MPDSLLSYYADRRREKRSRAAQQRRLENAVAAKDHSTKTAAYWREQAEEAERVKDWTYATECYWKVASCNQAHAEATFEILQRRKAMGF
ncbi:hypothetical protein CH289_10845 [Rhodococcus sp. RS1C4]|nr:hypothetical protein [Rhodococcus sp. RS1C4]OZC52783.1 hypothetical protein CH289_10845 [Rhodococcus sp. RS1C4]